MITNLVDNAVTYTPEGTVTLRVEERQEKANGGNSNESRNKPREDFRERKVCCHC